MRDIIERLGKLEAAACADVMVAMGLVDQVLSPDLVPIGNPRLVGRALCAAGDDAGLASSIPTFELDQTVRAGDVVVIASGGFRRGALIGDNMVTSMMARGAVGFILDSGIRDAGELAAQGVPLYCTYKSPTNGHRFWSYTSINEPITLPGIWGDVQIRSGDFILGDDDGVCVLPQQHAQRIIADTEIHMASEASIKTAILSGTPRDQATRASGRLQHVKPLVSGASVTDE